MKRMEITGQRFGKLVVLGFAYVKNRNTYWNCRCDCGKEKAIQGRHLKSGHTKSCGCLSQELGKDKLRKHGKSYTRIYAIYDHMKQRCYNSNNGRYKNYGGRGIKIADVWLNNFMNFYNWAMENGYDDNLTIDRIDVDGNYEPTNCQWLTRSENSKKENRDRKEKGHL